MKMPSWLDAVMRALLSTVLALFLAMVLVSLVGESPWHVLQVMAKSAFGTRYDIGMTLAYSTPLIFTGLAVAFAFHAGLFNIGGEGQLALGALTMAYFAIRYPEIPRWLALPLGVLMSVAGGSLFGWIAGWLKSYRQCHEVIATIMLNFIAASISSYFILHVLQDPSGQNPETLGLSSHFTLAHLAWFDGAPVTMALGLGLVVTLFVHIVLFKTEFGFKLRMLGQSESVARTYRINVSRYQMIAMAVSGGLAGLVGFAEVGGVAHKLRLGFSADYGFMGIAVSLLARNQPFSILATAFLFGALQKGASDLDFETERISKDMALILQAIIILTVCAEGIWKRWGSGGKK